MHKKDKCSDIFTGSTANSNYSYSTKSLPNISPTWFQKCEAKPDIRQYGKKPSTKIRENILHFLMKHTCSVPGINYGICFM